MSYIQSGTNAPVVACTLSAARRVTRYAVLSALVIAGLRAESSPAVHLPQPMGTFRGDGALVWMYASSTDSDGNLTTLEYLDNGSPFSPANVQNDDPRTTVKPLSVGTHVLTAVARDAAGRQTTSAPVTVVVQAANGNAAPTVTLNQTGTPTLTAGSTQTLTASASDPGGSVVKVDFFTMSRESVEPVLIGSDTSAPFTATWSNIQVGFYDVIAVATDNQGLVGFSVIFKPQVVAGANPPPTVTLTAPVHQSSSTSGQNVALTASAADNGSVAQVEFFAATSAGVTLLGADTSAPFTATLPAPAAGSFTLFARATDNLGGAATSNLVNLTVTGAGGGGGGAGSDGPGVPKQTFTANDVFLDRNVRELARVAVPPANGTPGFGHGRVSMIGGFLFVPFFTEEQGASGGGFDLYRLTSGSGGTIPASATANAPTLTPALRRNRPGSGPSIREAHGYGLAIVNGKRLVVMQATNGIEVWDFTVPLSPILIRNLSISGVNGSGDAAGYSGAWWVSLQWPFAYIGSNSAGLRIVDLNDPANPVLRTSMPTSSLGGFTVGSVHALGNLLVVASNGQSSTTAPTLGGGYSFFDISNPTNPVTLATYPTNPAVFPNGYSSMLNGNRLLIGGVGSTFQMLDVSNPLNIVRFPTLNGPGPGGYINFQDGFAFSGFQEFAIKVNVTGANATTAPVLTRQGTTAVVAADTGDLNFAMPLGNMLFAANDRLGKGSALLVHDTAPDNSGPVVNMVQPRAGSTGQALSTRVGLTFTDELQDSALTAANITLRQQGTTSALAATLSYQMNMVNVTPAVPLLAGTTYEIVVRANGIADVSGNTSPSSFTSSFTTAGATVSPLSIAIAKPAPTTLGAASSFTVANATGTAPLQFSWNFGDGVTTAFSTTSAATHTYSAPGHYSVAATVRDSSGATATSQLEIQVVFVAPTASAPAASGPLALLAGLNRLYVVNPDADTVTVIDTGNNTKVAEIAVGRHPVALAVRSADNTVWVANQDSATVSVISAGSNAVVATVALARATQPSGIAVAPNQAAVYVSLSASGQLAKIDPANRAIVGTPTAVGPTPRAVAVSHDSARILVTRFISSDSQGEVIEVNAGSMAISRTFTLPVDITTVDDERQSRGVANYLAGVAISPDGSVAWVPSKKDNIRRGLNRDGRSLNFQNTVRAVVSRLNLSAGSAGELIDINDSDAPSAVAFIPRGDLAFVATQGSNTVHLVDVFSNTTQVFAVGLAPQGLAVNAAGTRLYVQNFLGRSVQVFDISGMTGFTTGQATVLATITTVATEKLTASVLAGKRLFYDAGTRRMNSDGYISCASCHFDGGHDGRVWDFSDRGEGFRRTTDLRGRSGVGHGPVHWTGNFDEIHDFEHDIRGPFAGSGFMNDSDFNTGSRNTTLGLAKAGVSPDLDRLAAYVSSLSAAPASPLRNPDGTLTTAGTRGKALFITHNCASCHSGPRLTDSALNRFHDVGTLTQPTSGKRLGATLPGIDTPTLKGLWNTERYLHDGSQSSLAGVFQVDDPTPGTATHRVVTTLNAADQGDLFAYLRQIDEAETPAYLPQGADNIVVIEAEAFAAVQAPVGQAQSWVPVINATTFANTVAIQALPNSGSAPTANLNAASPRADYLVQFPAAATYTVWVLGQGATTADNTVFVGLNGNAPASTAGVALPTANGWAKSPDTITVAAGRQTINLWMREDGVVVDRILLTTNAGSPAPTGLGPNESATSLSGATGPTAPEIAVTRGGSAITDGGTDVIAGSVAGSASGLSYSIVNSGSAVLTLGSVSVGGQSNCTATVTAAPAGSVAAGGSTSLGLTVTPSAAAAWSFTVSFATNDADESPTNWTVAGTAVAANASGYQQDSGSDGLVIIEAESTQATRVAIGGKSWQTVTAPSGFIGTGAVQALANTGITVDIANLLSSSPRVDFPVTFTRTGTHFIWIRGLGATTADNSVSIGLDGVATTASDNLTLSTAYAWNNTNAATGGVVRTINVASAGLHTLNLWMREDGVVVDRVLLTVNAGFVPDFIGPVESPFGGGGAGAPEIALSRGGSAIADGGSDVVSGSIAGSASVLSTTIANSGTATLTVGSVALAGQSNCTATVTTSPAASVAAGGTTSMVVSVTPSTAAAWSFTVSFTTNDADESPTNWTVSGTAAAPAAGSFQQDSGSDGLVVIEAESTRGTRVSVGGKSWQTVTAPSGFIGTGAVQALANTGITVDIANLVSSSPRVDFPVTFTRTGSHFIWIRGLGATTADNSVSIGLDGVATTASDNVTLATTYAWKNTNAATGGVVRTINVATVGLHTLNLWMREDGVVVDRVLLTVNAGFVPDFIGPAESAFGSSPPPLPTGVSSIDHVSPDVSVSLVTGGAASSSSAADGFSPETQRTGPGDLIAQLQSALTSRFRARDAQPW